MGGSERVLTPRVLLLTTIFVVLVPLLPLLISRDWGWVEAWLYAIVAIGGFVISRVLAARRHPDIIAERARFMKHENAKGWDRRLVPMMALAAASILLVAGLDQRLGWSPGFPLALKGLSFLVILLGYALGSYALIENRFFSGMVRIQTDRGHVVVSTGPYRWIRHPGYAGALLTYLATPVLLDTSWGFLPAILTSIVLIIRTRLEDIALKGELSGYTEYASSVRSRLLPGVW